MGYFVEYAETNAKKKVREYVEEHINDIHFLEDFLCNIEGEKVQICSDEEWIELRGTL